jgi:hypothetical protein
MRLLLIWICALVCSTAHAGIETDVRRQFDDRLAAVSHVSPENDFCADQLHQDFALTSTLPSYLLGSV